MKKNPCKLLVIIPPLILGFLVWKYGVSVPFGDEWETPGLSLIKFNLNQITWHDLIAQHNESRMLFPRLLLISLSGITNWNTKYGMLVSFLLCCLTSFNIYYLSKITLNTTWGKRLVCLALANLLIFSPMQLDNWLWGLQFITFIPIAVITTSLAIIFSQNSLFLKLLISGALAIVATFSFANGMITWIILFPALILVAKNNKKSLALVVCYWLFLSSFILAIYFYNYHKLPNHPSLLDALFKPVQATAYFLSFIGSPLGVQDLISSQIVGIFILALIALAGFYLVKVNRSSELFFQTFPWLSIIFYCLGSGVLTTAGRVGFGVAQSLSSRYITFSTYGIVGLIYLLAIIATDLDRQINTSASKFLKIFSKIISVSMVLLLFLYPANFTLGVNQMIVTQKARFYGKACLNLINVIDDVECIKEYVFPPTKLEEDPNNNFLYNTANSLDRIGLIQPPLILSKNLQDISRDNFEQLQYGVFDDFSIGEDNTYKASGWSILPKYKNASHAVILAYQTQDNLDHPFAIVMPNIDRPDIVDATKTRQYLNTGWSKTFSQDLIPDTAVAVSAWSYDSQIARAYKLENVYPIDP